MITVYRDSSGVEVAVCEVSDRRAIHKRAIMGIDEVQVSVVVDSILDIEVGDYIKVGDVRYSLNRDADFTKTSDVQYNYEFIFEHPIYILLDKLYVHRVSGLSNFILTGKLLDFVNLLVWCVNKTTDNPLGIDAGWSVGEVVDTEFRNIVFSDLSCREVLNLLAKEFNAEYYANNKQINFVHRIENGTTLVFEQGLGKGLYSISQSNVDKEDAVTRIYPRGGDKNVPNQYADYEGHLVLPERYLENLSELNKVVEKKVTFDDEFPHFIGKVKSVSGTDNVVLTCPEIDFDIAQIAVGDNARINFLTGDLMGVSFKFAWDNGQKRITLIKQDDEVALPDESGQKPQIPNPLKKAKINDNFNFTGLVMPDSYVNASISRLRAKAQSYLEFYSRKRVKFDLRVDHRFMRGKQTLNPGDLVTINIPQKNLSKLIRITTLDFNIHTGEITCTVSNYLDEKWEKKIESQISSLASSVHSDAANAIERLVDIIERYDSRSPSDRNLFSALRTVFEIKNRAISKENNDTAAGIINFIQGLEVGDFSQGALGGGGSFKSNNGISELEVDKLTVRMVATFFELMISKLSHVGGQIVLSPARMKCTKVDDLGDRYRCYFKQGESGEVDNLFAIGDQARCQVFSGSGQKFYWRLVTDVGEDWIDLSKSDCISGSGVPEEGDDIVQLGNRGNTERQAAQILSTVGSDAPSYKQYAGINSYTLEGKQLTVLSSSGNEIVGNIRFRATDGSMKNIEEGIGDAINALEITGRNLLVGTNADYSGFSTLGGFSVVEKALYAVGNYYNAARSAYISVSETSKYTLSFEADVMDSNYRVEIENESGNGIYSYVIDGGLFSRTFDINAGQNFRVNFFGVSPSSSECRIRDIKLEKGSKATGWSPAPEDAPPSVKYLTDAVKNGTTEIAGGLALSSLMFAKGTDGKIRAGMSGMQNDNIAFFGGGTYQEAINGLANIILRKDGSGQLAQGNLWWDVLVKTSFGKSDADNTFIVSTDTIPTLSEILRKEKYVVENYNEHKSSNLNDPAAPRELEVSRITEFELSNSGNIDIGGEFVWGNRSDAVVLETALMFKFERFANGGWELIEEGEVESNENETYISLSKNDYPASKGRYRVSARAYCKCSQSVGPDAGFYVQGALSVKYQLKVKKLAIGIDGIALFDTMSNEYFRLSLQDDIPLRYKGKMDIPGILATGSVTEYRQHINQTGAKCSADQVSYDGSTGLITVPHKVGNMYYKIHLTAIGEDVEATVVSKWDNSFSFKVKRNGRITSCLVDYTLTGHNY